MAHALAQVRLRRNTNVPADAVVNTFHFLTPGPSVLPADAATIATRLIAFYNDAPVGGTPVRNILSELLSQVALAHEVRVYDQAAPEPRTPITTTAFTMDNPGGSVYPAEVALCLSFQGAALSGVPAARRRGRIYLGPLTVTTSSGTGGGDARPSPGTMTLVAEAGLRLASLGDALSPQWCVFSPTDNVLRVIRSVSVDDAFDTQRRRGADPTQRTVLTVPST